MCCWVYKPKGIEMIDRDEMINIVNTNPDGIGIAYTHNGKLRFAKGFMTFDEFEKFYNVLSHTIDIKNEALLFHARITTTKSVKPFQCHPFIVTDNVEELKKLHGETELLFVHNGSMQNFYSFNKKLSDTQNFDLHILSKMKELDKEFYKKEFYLNWISDLTQKSNDMYNRFCFMDKDGNATFIGDVIHKENGLVYSNDNHNYSISQYFNEFYDIKKVKLVQISLLSNTNYYVVLVDSNGEINDVLQKNKHYNYYMDENFNFYIEELSLSKDSKFILSSEYKVALADLNFKIQNISLKNITCPFKEYTVYFPKTLV